MNYTIAEKILLDHAHGIKDLEPGQFIDCKIDLIMVHEQLGGRIHVEYEKLGLDHVWDPEKVFFILENLEIKYFCFRFKKCIKRTKRRQLLILAIK